MQFGPRERRPPRVAVKPHASPVFHAIQYLLGRQTREKIEAFRPMPGASGVGTSFLGPTSSLSPKPAHGQTGTIADLYRHHGIDAEAIARAASALAPGPPPEEGLLTTPLPATAGLTCLVSCNIKDYMKRDSRLSGVLHVLLHMAGSRRPVTSETLALAMQTNPVVVRRIMAGLREAGLVRSEKGHGGGWTLARDLAAISLRDVHEALGEPSFFAIGNRTESPGCLVEQAVNATLDEAFREAEALLLLRFGSVTLAALSAEFHARMLASGQSTDLETIHASK